MQSFLHQPTAESSSFRARHPGCVMLGATCPVRWIALASAARLLVAGIPPPLVVSSRAVAVAGSTGSAVALVVHLHSRDAAPRLLTCLRRVSYLGAQPPGTFFALSYCSCIRTPPTFPHHPMPAPPCPVSSCRTVFFFVLREIVVGRVNPPVNASRFVESGIYPSLKLAT